MMKNKAMGCAFDSYRYIQEKSEKISYNSCTIFGHQLAGHGCYMESMAMLLYIDDQKEHFILKKIKKPYNESNLKELLFYLNVSQSNDSDTSESSLFKNFISRFHGVVCIIKDEQPEYYLKLTDLTEGKHEFCSMDVKIGTETYGPDFTKEKIEKLISKYPLQEEIAMRICGMKVFNYRTKKFLRRNSAWGKLATSETLRDFVALFFESGLDNGFYLEAVDLFLEKLEDLIDVFERQSSFRFISSSLIMTYSLSETGQVKANLKMIDFCHVYDSGVKDFGYLKGLKRLRFELKEFQKRLRD